MGLPLLTVRQVAAQLGVCAATVYALCARGASPQVRMEMTPGKRGGSTAPAAIGWKAPGQERKLP
jgi:hypothetical protein